MKIVNKTRCPITILERLLHHTAALIGADSTYTVCSITQGRSERISGLACAGGWLKIILPRCQYDGLSLAYSVWEVMAHEWGHIHDYQRMEVNDSSLFNNYGQHDSRPQEQRAELYVKTVKQRIADGVDSGCDDAILELALYLESQK